MKSTRIVVLAISLTALAGCADNLVQAPAFMENQDDVAARISLDGDRSVQRGDDEGAEEARLASEAARYAATVHEARRIEKNYNRDNFN